MPITITGTGDSRNIEVVNTDNPGNIQLNIRGDVANPGDFQWFNFEFEGTSGEDYVLNIENAGEARFPGWDAYDVSFQTSASYDGHTWFYVPTTYDASTGKLSMNVHLEENKIQLAFFPPYSYEKHLELIEFAQTEPSWNVTSLGKTNGEHGRDITLITIGEPAPDKKNIWVIARQHPGEPQAEWFMDGLIRHLKTSGQDFSDIFENAILYLVPNMNPDGTFLGNLRTNREGKDLNRMWQTATIKDSPEVYYVRNAMRRFDVDFFIDVHSDEEIPRAFLDLGHQSCLSIDETAQELESGFLSCYIQNPEIQDVLKYPPRERSQANHDVASAYVAEHFYCPSFTLEMPTKAWSWERSQNLGVDLLRVLRHMLPLLPKPWQELQSQESTQQIVLQAPGRLSFLEESSGRAPTPPPEAEMYTSGCRCSIS